MASFSRRPHQGDCRWITGSLPPCGESERPRRPPRRARRPRRLPPSRPPLARLPADPVAILRWFLVQVLHGNTALTHVSLLAGRSFSDAAFCQARARLPLAAYQAVLRGLNDALLPDTKAQGTWRGHRTFLVDGSSFSMPDTPELRSRFGTSGRAKPGCSFPVARFLALLHAGTGLLLEVIAAPLRAHEMADIGGVHPHLGKGDVLVGDRGFCSFAAPGDARRPRGPCGDPGHARQIVHFTPDRPHVGRDAGRRARAARGRGGCGVSASATRWSSGSSRRSGRGG